MRARKAVRTEGRKNEGKKGEKTIFLGLEMSCLRLLKNVFRLHGEDAAADQAAGGNGGILETLLAPVQKVSTFSGEVHLSDVTYSLTHAYTRTCTHSHSHTPLSIISLVILTEVLRRMKVKTKTGRREKRGAFAQRIRRGSLTFAHRQKEIKARRKRQRTGKQERRCF